MSREERLAQLVTQLDSDRRYAFGSRRFPGYVNTDDVIDIAEALADEFDGGTQERAKLAAAQNMKIACASGCNNCCRVQVVVYAPEALRIARWLLQPENSEAKDAFLVAYASWRAELGDDPERLAEIGKQPTQQAAYDALHLALWQKQVMCAFNREGMCSIYPVRPILCRNANALDTADRCVPNPPDGKKPSVVQFVPLEEFLKKATRMLHAAHNAISTQRHHQEPVSSAVYKLLQRAGSNRPNPL